jgi:hypothetical protein
MKKVQNHHIFQFGLIRSLKYHQIRPLEFKQNSRTPSNKKRPPNWNTRLLRTYHNIIFTGSTLDVEDRESHNLSF